ncbi:MAG: DUF2088 domain-containing protein [Candidatus Thorarchaeota archaeon]|nr:DUF2088 domain-containing protein [Candidatus Thorarchaeota archaeon]
MKLKVSYGDGKVELDIPDENIDRLIEPVQERTLDDPTAELERVMREPHGARLESLVAGKSVCLLVEDHTRDEPHAEMLHAIMPRLREARRVQAIVTTGSHEVEHEGNLRIVETIKSAARAAKVTSVSVSIHDCHLPDMVDLGETSRGTPVIVNRLAVGHDVYVVAADMKAHYFAGYSNALKDFLPGVCAFASIEANHAMALDPKSTFGRHPYHPDRSKRDNPLADDMREAMEMITVHAKAFTLSVISAGGKVVWADAGELEPVTSRGIEVLDRTASFRVEQRSRVIVSPGGYPQDKSLYHAQRALELTKNAVTDGGEILFLAECRDGVAPQEAVENFYNRLTAPLDEVLSSIGSKYHLYEHKAYKFAEMLKRVSRVKMLTALDEKTVAKAHLVKVSSAQSVIDQWIAENPKVKILVIDKGNKLSVYAA